jgi:hypothetical protein
MAPKITGLARMKRMPATSVSQLARSSTRRALRWRMASSSTKVATKHSVTAWKTTIGPNA